MDVPKVGNWEPREDTGLDMKTLIMSVQNEHVEDWFN